MAPAGAFVRQFLTALLDVILPPICHICHEFIPNSGTLHICPTCRERLPLVLSPLCPICGIPFIGVGNDHRCGACLTDPPHYDTARAPFLYEGAIRELIHSFKYNRNTPLRRPLVLLTQEGMDEFLRDLKLDVILPVPLHRSRLRQRGFNQAVLLGRVLSRHFSLPLLPDTLVRIRQTSPQIELSASERRQNVKGAFAVKKTELVAGKRILLLDDVMTTGSTMDECAKELKKAGAALVVALTVARTAR
jgi:ComF family protein